MAGSRHERRCARRAGGRRHWRAHVPGGSLGTRAVGARLPRRARHRPARPGLGRPRPRRRAAPHPRRPLRRGRHEQGGGIRRAGARHHRGRPLAAPAGAGCRNRLRRLSLGADHAGGGAARCADAAARAECDPRPRQPAACAARRAHRHLLRRSERRAPGRPRPPGRDRQSRAPGDHRAARDAVPCARRRRAVPCARARRQPGRAGAERSHSRRLRSPARTAAPATAPGAAGAARGYRGGAARPCRERRRRRARDLLRRRAGAARSRAAGDLALRRLDRGGARHDRPAGDPGALSPRRRRSPDRERARARAGWRRLGHAACRLYAGRAGRAARPADGRAGDARPRRRRRACARAAPRGARARRPRHRHDRGPQRPSGAARPGACHMRAIPLDIGTLHFVGIGGIGMSGIAEIMHNLGYQVQGSDVADSANVQRLRALGIRVEIGHRAENLGDAKVVVVSSAVKKDNPEVAAARAHLVPVVRRAEMLGELMRLKWAIAVAGTHGKTTTTSMVGALLDAAQLDPTVINGGIINAYGTNARLGAGDWMVVEADESDGTFVKLPATIAVVTNIDPEHLDFYGTFAAVQQAFETFVGNIPFYGFAALCIDHPVVQGMIPKLSDRRVVTYGMSPQADIRAVDVRLGRDGARFDAVISDALSDRARTIPELFLPMFGQHNVQNSLAAVAVAEAMGLGDDALRGALRNFAGVKRRFTKTGEWNGVTVIDDYGHHPVEIAAVLKAARAIVEGKVIAVVQPHRYTRLHDLFAEFCTCFNDADAVLVADVYAAGEQPIEGVNRDALVAGLLARGHRNAQALPAPGQLAVMVRDMAKPGDFVVCLGAGSITNWAHSLPGELDKLGGGGAS